MWGADIVLHSVTKYINGKNFNFYLLIGYLSVLLSIYLEFLCIVPAGHMIVQSQQ